MDQPTLYTDRLILRAPHESDRRDLPFVLGDPEIRDNTRNIPYPYTDEDASCALQRYASLASNGKALTLFVEEQDTHQLVGLVVLIVHEAGQIGELGYALGRMFWGKGYATEASAALLEYGFGTLGFQKIGAHTRQSNTGSCRVLEKLGMESLGIQKESCETSGEKIDANGFMMTREQWAQR